MVSTTTSISGSDVIASGSEPVWATCPQRSGFGVRVATWVTLIGQPARAVINRAFCSSSDSVPPPTVPRPQMPTDKISLFFPLKIVLFYCALDPDHRLIFSSLKREVRKVIRHHFLPLTGKLMVQAAYQSNSLTTSPCRRDQFRPSMAAAFHCPYTQGPGDHQKNQCRRTADTKLVTQLIVIQNRRVAGDCWQVFPSLARVRDVYDHPNTKPRSSCR